MKPNWKVILPAAVLALLTGSLLLMWRASGSSPRRILGRTLRTYQQASAFHERGRLVWRVMVGSTLVMQEQMYDFSFRRPDRFRYQTTSAEGKQVAVCDGRHLYVQMATSRRVLKTGAPSQPLAALQRLQAGPAADAVFVSTATLLEGKLPEPLAVRSKGKGKLGPAPCAILELELPQGARQTLWIEGRRGLLRKYALQLDPKTVRTIVERAAAVGRPRTPQALEALLAQSALQVTVELDEVELDPVLEDDRFAYQPPAGFQVAAEGSAGLPAAGLANSQQEEVTCQSRLSQLAQALRAYAAAHDGQLPDYRRWQQEISPYLKNQQALRCPAAGGNGPHYQMSSKCQGRLAKIEDLQGTILLFECSPEGRPVYRHPGGIGLAFADGHVKRLPKGAVKSGMWTPAKGD